VSDLPLEVDVTIIGAGVAGTATARALGQRGFSVCMLVRDEPEAWSLGESLPAHTTPLLERLDLLDKMTGSVCMPSEGVDSCWGTDAPQRRYSIQDVFGSGFLLDRPRFDALLRAAAVESGARLMPSEGLRTPERHGERWRLEFAAASPSIETRFLVDATGRQRWLVKRLHAEVDVDSAGQIAIATELSVPQDAPPPSPSLLIETTESGWWYFAPIPHGRAMGVFMTDVETLRASGLSHDDLWARELEATHYVRERMQGMQRVRSRVARCESSCMRSAVGAGFAAVGDASMTFDPLASAGLQMALADGLDLADALSSGSISAELVLSSFADARRHDYERYLKELTGYYELERRWPHSAYWARRQRAAREAWERNQPARAVETPP